MKRAYEEDIKRLEEITGGETRILPPLEPEEN